VGLTISLSNTCGSAIVGDSQFYTVLWPRTTALFQYIPQLEYEYHHSITRIKHHFQFALLSGVLGPDRLYFVQFVVSKIEERSVYTIGIGQIIFFTAWMWVARMELHILLMLLNLALIHI
jgi:hypothetical protein